VSQMFKLRQLLLTLAIAGATFVAPATATAGMNLLNHNETLLLDT
jgi:hypothetical protein